VVKAKTRKLALTRTRDPSRPTTRVPNPNRPTKQDFFQTGSNPYSCWPEPIYINGRLLYIVDLRTVVEGRMSYTMWEGRRRCPGGGNVRGEYLKGKMSGSLTHTRIHVVIVNVVNVRHMLIACRPMCIASRCLYSHSLIIQYHTMIARNVPYSHKNSSKHHPRQSFTRRPPPSTLWKSLQYTTFFSFIQ